MRKFGVLAGFGRNAARAAEEEAKKKAKVAKAEEDDQDETEAEDEEDDTEEDAAEDDDTEDGDASAEDGESDEDDEDSKQGARKARRQERKRCRAIVTSAEADGRLALACHFAFNTSMSAKSAIAGLKAAPKSEAGGKGGLAAAMAQLGNPKIGMDGKKAPQSRAGIDHRAIYDKFNGAKSR